MKTKPTCGYCIHFQSGERRYQITKTRSGDKRIAMRKCRVTGELKEVVDLACSNFKGAQRFWCDKRSSWMEPLVCFYSRFNKMRPCKVSCEQGKFVDSLAEMEA